MPFFLKIIIDPIGCINARNKIYFFSRGNYGIIIMDYFKDICPIIQITPIYVLYVTVNNNEFSAYITNK
jgi:hypothetical protein